MVSAMIDAMIAMSDAMIAIAVSIALHSANVEMDEQIRYEQLAQLAESRQIAQEAESWYWEPQYQEYDVTWDYTASNDTFDASDGITAAEFQYYGVVDDGTHFYTWYSERVLPGGGLTELNENGRHSEGGFVKDGDGYIAVASCDYPKGTVIDTPFGAAKVYDTGYLAEGQVDVYVSF